jgi:hypothetical protein
MRSEAQRTASRTFSPCVGPAATGMTSNVPGMLHGSDSYGQASVPPNRYARPVDMNPNIPVLQTYQPVNALPTPNLYTPSMAQSGSSRPSRWSTNNVVPSGTGSMIPVNMTFGGKASVASTHIAQKPQSIPSVSTRNTVAPSRSIVTSSKSITTKHGGRASPISDRRATRGRDRPSRTVSTTKGRSDSRSRSHERSLSPHLSKRKRSRSRHVIRFSHSSVEQSIKSSRQSRTTVNYEF